MILKARKSNENEKKKENEKKGRKRKERKERNKVVIQGNKSVLKNPGHL